MVLVRGHICEAGSRVEARQERDTAFSVGRQEANTSTTRPTTFNLLCVCLGYLNRVTVSGVTRIQLFCLAQAHPTWHPPGRRPLPFVATTSILAPPSPTPHHHSHSIAAPGSEARGIPPKVSNSDLPTVATAPRHLETLTLATVNACNRPPRAPPDQCKRRQWLVRRRAMPENASTPATTPPTSLRLLACKTPWRQQLNRRVLPCRVCRFGHRMSAYAALGCSTVHAPVVDGTGRRLVSAGDAPIHKHDMSVTYDGLMCSILIRDLQTLAVSRGDVHLHQVGLLHPGPPLTAGTTDRATGVCESGCHGRLVYELVATGRHLSLVRLGIMAIWAWWDWRISGLRSGVRSSSSLGAAESS